MSRPITFCCNNMSIYDTASNHFPIMCAWAAREERRLTNKNSNGDLKRNISVVIDCV